MQCPRKTRSRRSRSSRSCPAASDNRTSTGRAASRRSSSSARTARGSARRLRRADAGPRPARAQPGPLRPGPRSSLGPPPAAGRARVSEISLVAGIAVAEAVEGAVGLAVQIKWPNDVMLNRRKVAGVLAEAADGRRRRRDRPERQPGARRASGRHEGRGRLALHDRRDPARARAAPRRPPRRGSSATTTAWLERGLDGVYDSLGSRDFLRGRRVVVDGESGVGRRDRPQRAVRRRDRRRAAQPSRAARSCSSAS